MMIYRYAERSSLKTKNYEWPLTSASSLAV